MAMQKNNNELVVGLDIGTTKICAIVGRKNEFGKLEILGMGTAVSEGVIRGMVTNINSTMQSIVKAVKEGRKARRPGRGKGHCGESGIPSVAGYQ